MIGQEIQQMQAKGQCHVGIQDSRRKRRKGVIVRCENGRRVVGVVEEGRKFSNGQRRGEG